ncbi:MAG: phospho-N-acetylmuramoyl-pentapeptide-transferase [Lentimicrobiaceae bacterium]|nr:phospho-N-acetylmuramoyl-pentapeptide-transferase [Lentimicrobiaceae bacterium]
MFYYLFKYLDQAYDFPGAGAFQYISFRAALAVITSLLISMVFGKSMIRMLQKKQIGESVRELGLKGQSEKAGTPTMGGLIILSAILLPTLFFARLDNIYIILMLISTVWLGIIGFMDDYIKVFKKNKKGLAGKFKILGQIVLGLVIGLTILSNDNIVIREKIRNQDSGTTILESIEKQVPASARFSSDAVKSTKTTIPFFKNNELDYAKALKFLGQDYHKWAFLIYVPLVILIIIGVSNGANLTDGLDGLATGTSAVAGATLGILAWVSGNIIFADYLNIMYIPNLGELAIYISAFVGACIGFMWYNSYPAQVFMGDTGSLSLGGAIAVCAILIRKELLIPVLCGIFLAESLSVMIQVSWFKYTRIRFGEGRRIFKMAPVHHHYQMKGYPEPKIVQRFLIVGILLAVLSVITLKMR